MVRAPYLNQEYGNATVRCAPDAMLSVPILVILTIVTRHLIRMSQEDEDAEAREGEVAAA